MSFLLDTDICSAHLKLRGVVSNRLLQHTGGLYVSAITLGELYAWALRAGAPPKRLEGLRQMFDDVKILEVTADVAAKFGQLQAALLDVGKPAPGMDLMIAATALVHDLTLVTHNSQDFTNIPTLRLADWLAP
jgi:tRNA(fMet)-specific endonuclease VapC